ncbi:YdeI family protein [Tateyamaria armeniaca]|uniref:YdeI family protein n=1 Tax=Tateyamaria armeniaca TaxID=2518930 RepID=A0ABW8UT38_9RHOB
MSEDWLTFEGRIEPMEWGKNTYTVLRIPDDIMAALPDDTRRIEGEFGDHPVNLALTKAPVIEGVFVYTGKAFLKESGLAPGETFDARIRAADPDLVELPDDVAAALRAAGRSSDWAALSPGNQRGRLHLVTSAKRADTRARRIATLIAEL